MTLGRRPGGRLHARSRVQEDAETNLIEEAGTAGDNVAVTTAAAVLLEQSQASSPVSMPYSTATITLDASIA